MDKALMTILYVGVLVSAAHIADAQSSTNIPIYPGSSINVSVPSSPGNNNDINSGPTNPAQSPFGGFQLVVCDGPTLPSGDPYYAKFYAQYGRSYVPCDFNAVMLEAQHLINVMIVLGVVAAICISVYAGFLYISGTQENIKKAKSIFPKLAWGFILMLTAWFIVYQILSWLTGSAGFLSGSGL